MKSLRLHLSTLVTALSHSSRRAITADKGVIIQMFGWNWDSIAAECTNFIGPAGYGFVQTGAPQESLTGDAWWTQYQVVSYNIESKFGTRTQYQNMIDTCHTAGVKVIADAVFNHMAGVDSGSGTAGSTFTHYSYPGIYETTDFHYCGTDGNNIQDYNIRAQVQNCQLANLADLDTGSESVRAKIAAFGNDLLSLGVDGLRIDAAKHIANTELADIVSRLTIKPYITQEVAYGGEVKGTEYTSIGNVQEFQFASTVANAFLTKGISTLQTLVGSDWIPSASSNVFIANHDTERQSSSLTSKSPSNIYVLAHVFMLAHPYGKPTVLSGFDFTSSDAGAPNNGAGSCDTNSGWTCQHRNPAIAGMTAFRNTVGSSSDLVNWISSGTQRVAFGRGTAGFVAINNEDTTWPGTFTSSLPQGEYCNAVDTDCHTIFSVGADGTFGATVGARNAIALHVGAMKST